MFAGLFTALLVGGLWVPVTLGITGIAILVIAGYGAQLPSIGAIYWNNSGSFVLIAIPLFMLMGEIILESGMSKRFYRAITPWVRHLPGGLYNTNIVASALFSAVCGSSVATAAAIGTVAIPELRSRGYADRLTYGSIAAGGTLGILIPPSATLIIYGSMVNENIAELFMAALLPGIGLALLFMAYIIIASLLKPGMAPRETIDRLGVSYARELLRTLPDMGPLVLLIIGVMGGIYSGIVTPTEAAALGAVAAIIIGYFTGDLRTKGIFSALRRSVISTGMIMFIILGAQILSFAMARTGVSRALVDGLLSLGLPSGLVLLALILMYIVLGFFVEAISMMVLTLPLVYPVIQALGFDGVWFGVVLVIIIEVGLIHPPVGLNLFVVQNYAGKPGQYKEIVMGALPFVFVMFGMVYLLYLWPQIALWLPGQL
ncbi:hypothetical protein JP75_20250 [Devosia riboflavina]|uniref:TRAP transporter large permease protein n=1 Tax=Devosia riboflavina TaxID=46914 RepID=A0A087LY68_9HYPH|nr:hypothetical protein JP75_20250 [Devosia riboflavina]